MHRRRRWNNAGLILSTLYLLFTLGNKFYINSVFEKSMNDQGIAHSRSMTYPTFLNNILWSVVAEDNKGYWVGYYSLLDKDKHIEFSHFLRNDSLIEDIKNNQAMEKLLRFSKGYYCISSKDNKMYYNDIRFGQIAGWSHKDADFVFSFEIQKISNGVNIKKGEWRMARMMGLRELFERIKGSNI